MAPQFMSEPVSQDGSQGRLLRVLGSAPFRLLLLSTAALFGIWLVQQGSSGENSKSALRLSSVWLLAAFLAACPLFSFA